MVSYICNSTFLQANGSHNKPLDVVQMQYTGWPDYGVPSHPSFLVKFVQQVRKQYKDSTAPLLVHCRWVHHGEVSGDTTIIYRVHMEDKNIT